MLVVCHLEHMLLEFFVHNVFAACSQSPGLEFVLLQRVRMFLML